MRGLAAAGGEDGVADTTRILDHGVIPDPQDAIAKALEIGRPPLIVGDLFGVLAAVEFDDELGLEAQKIDDVGATRDLPLPFPAAELAVAERLPNARLNLRVRPAQFPRSFSAPRFIDAALT